MVKLLGKSRQILKGNAKSRVNESVVRTRIVIPILELLGWDADDPQMMEQEAPLDGRRADIILSVKERKQQYSRKIIVETKRPGKAGATDSYEQVLDYAQKAGITIAVLIDGGEFRFYRPLAAESAHHQLVKQIDLLDTDSLEEAAGIFDRYLSFQKVKNHQAFNNIKKDYHMKVDRYEAKSQIPRIWQELIKDEDELLVDRLVQATWKKSNCKPDSSDVLKFLASLTPLPEKMLAKKTERPRNSQSQKFSSQKLTIASTKNSDCKTCFILLGESYDEPCFKEAYAFIFTQLAYKFKLPFLKKLEAGLKGTRCTQVSKDIKRLPKKGQNRCHKLPWGYKLCLGLQDKNLFPNLKKACDIAEIDFGHRSGLEINKP